ncbi:MAG: hypothetical protein LBG58_02595 [Planctomycetaceae bacterium]|jgi:hypothetical protein|nr:hypothetical protein [Planctomycetaceae bacterium]
MKEGFFSSKAWLNIGLFFALVASGVWWSQSSIKSSRPDDSQEALTNAHLTPGKANARSWQDPFELLETLSQKDYKDYKKLEQTFFNDLNKNNNTLKCNKINASKEQPPLLLMGVMVPGGPFGDRAERRQRLRVAVASALAAGGYAPENGEKLGFFPFNVSGSSDTEKYSKPKDHSYLYLPYEFFYTINSPERRNSAPKSVFKRILVVWIPDDNFVEAPNPTPIKNLKKLRDDLLRNCPDYTRNPLLSILFSFCNSEKLAIDLSFETKNNQPANKTSQWDNVPFYVFGPWSSTTLKAIYHEITTGNDSNGGSAVQDIQDAKMTFFNVFATAPLHFIMKNDEDINKIKDHKKLFQHTSDLFSRLFGEVHQPARFKSNWLYLTSSDSLVAEAVAEELQRRGIRFDNDNIAMIAENDTLFGRALPKTFRNVFETINNKTPNKKTSGKEYEEYKNFFRFTYLRGLDGTIQSKQNNKDLPNSTPERNNASLELSLQKRLASAKRHFPEGNNQYDYLLRLRDEMRQTENLTGKKIKAIGILGSDVYDKLLLMQVLRPAFPNAIFFTTDLDAILWQSPDLPWTKNLLVGSSHGLKLRHDYQHNSNIDENYQLGILPFRFSYQTALFQGILGTTTIPDHIQCNRLVNDPLLLPSSPRLFEIGWHGPVDLSPQNSPLHPDRITTSARFGIIKSISVLTIIILFLFALNWFKKPLLPLLRLMVSDADNKPVKSFLYLFGLVVVAIIICAIINHFILLYCHYNETGEPYFWYSGVSAWPAIILWGIVIILSIILIGCAIRNHRQTINNVQNLYLPEPTDNARLALQQTFSLFDFWNWLKESWKKTLKEPSANQTDSATDPFNSPDSSSNPPDNSSNSSDDSFNLQNKWYKWRSEKKFRAVWDSVLFIFIFIVVCWLLTDGGKSNLHAPYRDQFSFCIGEITRFVSYFSFLALLLGTTLLSKCCISFIKDINDHLNDNEFRWLPDCVTRFEQKWNVNISEISDLIGVYFVARFTAKTCNLVLYPIVPLVLLVIAQSSIFENFGYNGYYYLLFAVISVMIFAPAYQLRREAAKIKQKLIERQRAKLNYQSNLNQDDDQRKRIEKAINETENIREGAFQSLLEHPFVQAILFLLGGISLPTLLGLASQSL